LGNTMKISITELSITLFSIMQFLHSLYKNIVIRNWKKYSFVEKIIILGSVKLRKNLKWGFESTQR